MSIHTSLVALSSPKHGARTAVLLCALLASGCGTNPGDRAVSGAMLGAAGGALIGAATGNPSAGAAIGAVGGAVIGATTNPCDLDLGSPYWRHHGGRRSYEDRCGRRRHHDDPPE